MEFLVLFALLVIAVHGQQVANNNNGGSNNVGTSIDSTGSGSNNGVIPFNNGPTNGYINNGGNNYGNGYSNMGNGYNNHPNGYNGYDNYGNGYNNYNNGYNNYGNGYNHYDDQYYHRYDSYANHHYYDDYQYRDYRRAEQAANMAAAIANRATAALLSVMMQLRIQQLAPTTAPATQVVSTPASVKYVNAASAPRATVTYVSAPARAPVRYVSAPASVRYVTTQPSAYSGYSSQPTYRYATTRY